MASAFDSFLQQAWTDHVDQCWRLASLTGHPLADSRVQSALLRAARSRLAATPTDSAAVHRPLAIACNNMVWELHDRGSARNAEDTAAMLDVAAAETAFARLSADDRAACRSTLATLKALTQ